MDTTPPTVTPVYDPLLADALYFDAIRRILEGRPPRESPPIAPPEPQPYRPEDSNG